MGGKVVDDFGVNGGIEGRLGLDCFFECALRAWTDWTNKEPNNPPSLTATNRVWTAPRSPDATAKVKNFFWGRWLQE